MIVTMSKQDDKATQIRVKQSTVNKLTVHLKKQDPVLLRLSWPELLDLIIDEWIATRKAGK